MQFAHNDERAAAILGRKANGSLALDEALAELADANCAIAIAAMIAERIRMDTELILRALDAESDVVISVMCRAAGLSINGYSALLRMRRRCNLGTESPPADALTFFSGLSRASSEQALQQLVARDRDGVR